LGDSCSKETITCPYHEADESSPHTHTVFILDPTYYTLKSTLCLQSGLFPSGFAVKLFMYFSYVPCVLHVPQCHPTWCGEEHN